MEIHEHDIVRLKDGREGTVVQIFTRPNLAYMVEIGEEMEEWPIVVAEEIDEVIWKMH